MRQLGYGGLAVVMALEHVFPPIPSEIVLPLAGFEVGRGGLLFVGALVASTLGSVVGASILYWLARKGGRTMVLRFGPLLRIDDAALRRAEDQFARHGTWVVLLGRLVPGVRSLISLPPGLLRMPFTRYLALTAVGSLAWNALLIETGVQLGSRWEQVASVVASIATGVGGLVVLAGGAWSIRWYRRRARRAAEAEAAVWSAARRYPSAGC